MFLYCKRQPKLKSTWCLLVPFFLRFPDLREQEKRSHAPCICRGQPTRHHSFSPLPPATWTRPIVPRSTNHPTHSERARTLISPMGSITPIVPITPTTPTQRLWKKQLRTRPGRVRDASVSSNSAVWRARDATAAVSPSERPLSASPQCRAGRKGSGRCGCSTRQCSSRRDWPTDGRWWWCGAAGDRARWHRGMGARRRTYLGTAARSPHGHACFILNVNDIARVPWEKRYCPRPLGETILPASPGSDANRHNNSTQTVHFSIDLRMERPIGQFALNCARPGSPSISLSIPLAMRQRPAAGQRRAQLDDGDDCADDEEEEEEEEEMRRAGRRLARARVRSSPCCQ
eukprot:gene24448-biopygen8945